MSLKKIPRYGAAIAVGLLVVLLLPFQVWAQGDTQTGSLDAGDISGLFNVVLVMAIVVFLLVEGLLIFAIVRYRRRTPDEMPEQVHGNTAWEVSWTVGSAVIVLVLFFFTLGFYQQRRATPTDAYVVEVTGRTWQWDFYYPDTGVTTVDTLNVPAGRPVVLEITSADVQHSFWVPELAGKVDAVPGRVQRMWFQVDEPRQYVGQCAEYCGRQHYAMLITLNVMPQVEFAQWMEGEAAAVAAAAATDLEQAAQEAVGDPAAGQQLYNALGCMACHSLDGSELVGPSFQGLGQVAGGRIEGYTAEEYLRESILRPCDFVVEGYTCVMPQNYGDRLSGQDLADLVAFLLEQ